MLCVSIIVYIFLGIFTFQPIMTVILQNDMPDNISNEETIQDIKVVTLNDACDLALAKSQAWDKRCKLSGIRIVYTDYNGLEINNSTYKIKCSFIQNYQLPVFINVFFFEGSLFMANAYSTITGNNHNFSSVATFRLSDMGYSDFILWKEDINNECVIYILNIIKKQYIKTWDSGGSLVITYLNDSRWLIDIYNKNETITVVYNSEYENLTNYRVT